MVGAGAYDSSSGHHLSAYWFRAAVTGVATPASSGQEEPVPENSRRSVQQAMPETAKTPDTRDTPADAHEYRGLKAAAWDLLRRDTCQWPTRALYRQVTSG